MLRSYEDITKRLGEPIWYDEHGCPRYDSFKPDMCGVYDNQVVLLEIRCQNCGRLFKVSSSWDRGRVILNMAIHGKCEEVIEPLPKRDGWGKYHYGDPPNHGCVGDTMNSEPERVLQFWQRDKFCEWVRNKDEEIIWRDYEKEGDQA